MTDKRETAAGPDTVAQAVGKAEEGCSCSEAIFVAYAERFGLDKTLAMRIAGGFGGGMGGMGETCGAVTAAFMVLGLKYGAKRAQDSYEREHTYLQVAEFARRFADRRGSVRCRDLCPRQAMSVRPQAKTLRESGLPSLMIQTAAELLEEFFLQEQ